MHIEPGIVNGAKLLLSYGTAAAAGTCPGTTHAGCRHRASATTNSPRWNWR